MSQETTALSVIIPVYKAGGNFLHLITDLAGQETDFRRRQIQRRQDEEKLERETQVRRGNCDSARERLALSERARLYRREGGEKVYYSEAEHSAALERLRGLVSKYCG